MEDQTIKPHRKSYMEIGEIFFWTATINKWQLLLKEDSYKEIVVRSLDHLSGTGKIDVFAFVIMPTHMHLIWRTNALNGKETAQGSLLKFTAHEFQKLIRTEQESILASYKVSAMNKQYEFWLRDSLAIHLYTKKVAYQKLDYIHYNPCQEHWKLVKDPSDYVYSSAGFYEKNIARFAFLKDLREEFG